MTTGTELLDTLEGLAASRPRTTDSTLAAGGDLYFGPAVVVEAGTDAPRVLVGGRRVVARPAMMLRYEAAVGDLLLVAGRGAEWYAIGVIRGRGLTVLDAPGDLRIETPRGSLDLKAARGLSLSSPRLRLRARRLDVVARVLVERAETLQRRVTGAVLERLGRLHSRVEATWRVRAGRITQKAVEEVKIDGRKIHLG